MQRNMIRSIVRFFFNRLPRVEVSGLENIPDEGGYILASNHLSRLDAPLIFTLVEREDVSVLVADKYQKNPFLRWLFNSVHGIWVNREEAEIGALRAARDYLQKGGALGIAPEGTRSKTKALTPAKTGVAYLADKAGVPVIPIAITGTEEAIKRLFRFRRPSIQVKVGRPFLLPPLSRKDRSAALQRNTDEIMCRIAALLPQRYRGVYTGHPCCTGETFAV